MTISKDVLDELLNAAQIVMRKSLNHVTLPEIKDFGRVT